VNPNRLELTWANKDMRLLAHDDVSYEWVDPADWRVSEVRLLEHVDEVGDASSGNLLIRGDALHALTALSSLPEIAAEYVGKVKLCYIDPPFNTGQTFQHYDDALEHSVWLTMLRDRLVQIKKLLSPNGSVWVHLDDVEAHRARCVLDEVFGADRFVATIVWEKDKGRRSDTDISTVHDYLTVYAMDRERWKQARNLIPRSAAQLGRYRNPDGDPRGPWLQGDNGSAKSGSESSRWPIVTPSGRSVVPPAGRGWGFSRETFNRALSEGRVYFGRNGDGAPIIKTYLSEVQQGIVPRTWWTADEAGFNQEAKRDHLKKMFPDDDPFSTPKPERLLERVIRIASNPGDLVLDCFAGSGTTAAVAHKMGRRWVTIELSRSIVEKFTRPRLEKVVAGTDPGGITSVETAVGGELPEGVEPGQARAAARVLESMAKSGALDDVGGVSSQDVKTLAKVLRNADKTTLETVWHGGGGFAVAEVGPSMFEEVEGVVVLAEWAIGGELARAVAAQVRYSNEPDIPFAGRKGRSRLAVIDGMLTTGVVDFLVGRLEETETLLVYAQALEPGIEEYVRAARSGSRAKKVPRDLARSGTRPSQLVLFDAVPA